MIDGIRYLNCGDWIENNSYIIEKSGIFEIRTFENV
jgi:UDP-2,3-diacylglucosamine pyrophosphatase LpxH